MKLINTFLKAFLESYRKLGINTPKASAGYEHLTAILDDIEKAECELISRTQKMIVFLHKPSNQTCFFEKIEFNDNGKKHYEIVLCMREANTKDYLILNSNMVEKTDKENLINGFKRMVNMVRSYDEFVSLCKEQPKDFYILLSGCLRSSKNIQMTGKDEFAIFHEIDGEYQYLTKDELEPYTNILSAIETERFFLYD